MYRLTLHVDPHQNLWGESYLYTGLALLAAAGEIDLSVRPFRHQDPVLMITRLHVEDLETGARRDIAIDLLDRADLIHSRVVAECDLYFKRSHDPAIIDRLDPDLAEKIRPFGLVFPCRSEDSTRRILRNHLGGYCRRLILYPRSGISRLRHDYRILREFLASPFVDSFLSPPNVRLEPKILFQTRVWTAEDTTDDFEQVNLERVNLVRALRKEFGDRFCGGIVPTPIAVEQFSDALTANNCSRAAYVALAKRCLIGIYSRGLHHSTAFKMSEYLAASKCIVSESLKHSIPTALEHNENLLNFTTPDECITHCAALLDDPDRAAAMRQANWTYFHTHVHPAAALRRLLKHAFRDTGIPPVREPVGMSTTSRSHSHNQQLATSN